MNVCVCVCMRLCAKLNNEKHMKWHWQTRKLSHNTKAYGNRLTKINGDGTNNNRIEKKKEVWNSLLHFEKKNLHSFIRVYLYLYLCHFYWTIAIMVALFNQYRWLKTTTPNNVCGCKGGWKRRGKDFWYERGKENLSDMKR